MTANVMGSTRRIGSIAGTDTELVPGTAEIRNKLMAATTLGLRLGAKYPTVKNDVEALVSRIQAQTERANRVAGDRTRNQYQKHLFARDLANDISAEIMRTKDVLSRKSKELIAEGEDLVEGTLGPRDNYAALYSEIRSWVRENKTTPEGLQRISDAYKENLSIAQAIYHSPHQLLNMEKGLHQTMRMKAAELFEPKGFAMLNEGVDIGGVLKHYDRTNYDVHRSYYHPEMVAEAEASVVQ